MYDARAPPSYFGRWSPSMSERPDVYISDVTKSVVLEVRAGEIVVSDSYPTFYSLRFPRVVKIRYDKDWNDGLNQEQLNELISNFNETRRMNKHKHKLENDSDYSEQEESKSEDQPIKAKKRKVNP